MILLIDIGNTRIKWKFYSEEDESEASGFIYEAVNLISNLNKVFNSSESHVSRVYISNVAGDEIKSKIYQWVADRFGIEPLFAVSSSEKCGLISAYTPADSLGVDRFLAMIGAKLLNDQPKVVVDCGTATTVDCINMNNEFIGGLILPGVGLMRKSLSSGASALEILADDKNIDYFSTDTASAILSGTVLSTSGVIENAVSQLTLNCGADVSCIITGGDGNFIRSHLEIEAEYHPDLVLKGLSEYFRAE